MTFLNKLGEVQTNLKLHNIDKKEIATALERANRMMVGKVGSYSIDNAYVTDSDRTTLQLRFNDIISIAYVYKNGDLISSSNYSIENTTGIITFSGINFFIEDKIKVYYTHRLMADLELYYVERFLLAHKYIEAESEIKNTKLEELKEMIKETINMINGNLNCVPVKDHKTYRGSVWR